VGTSAAGGSGNGSFGTLILSPSNTLTAGTLNVGINNGGGNTGSGVLSLGATNTINVDNILVGTGKSQGTTGTINFAAPGGALTLRGAAGGASRVTSVVIGDYSGITAGSSTAGAGVADLTGGNVDARIDSLTLAVAKSQSGTPNILGTLTFNEGTIDVNTVTLGAQPVAQPVGNAPATGTINVNGTANLIVGAGGVTLGKITVAAPVAGVLNVNGGTATMGADVVDGGGTSTVTVNGGTLDMNGKNLGTPAAMIDTINLFSGTLKNVAQVNDGVVPVVKSNQAATPQTLEINGTNAFTNPVTVNGGTLRVTTSIASSAGVTVNTGGTFEAASVQMVKALTVNNGGAAKVTAGVLKVGDNVSPTPLVVDGTNGNTGVVDLAGRGMIVDVAPGDVAATFTAVRTQVLAGYNPSAPGAGDGNWQGKGITSSNAAADFNAKGVGYALASDIVGAGGGAFMGGTTDGDAVLARYTLLGDANLDGAVNFNDLVQLAQSYNVVDGSRTWFTGDFTYDGNTNFNDLVKLAQNYNTALPTEPIPGASAQFAADLAAAFASVPEPGAVGLVGLGACGLMLRRRGR
jgi:autotransporter-associated beta strand protein